MLLPLSIQDLNASQPLFSLHAGQHGGSIAAHMRQSQVGVSAHSHLSVIELRCLCLECGLE